MVWQKKDSERCYLVEFVIKLAERDFQQSLLHPEKNLDLFNLFTLVIFPEKLKKHCRIGIFFTKTVENVSIFSDFYHSQLVDEEP